MVALPRRQAVISSTAVLSRPPCTPATPEEDHVVHGLPYEEQLPADDGWFLVCLRAPDRTSASGDVLEQFTTVFPFPSGFRSDTSAVGSTTAEFGYRSCRQGSFRKSMTTAGGSE